MSRSKPYVFATVTRVDPIFFRGERTSGYLGRFDENIDIETIKRLYGGGAYDIKFFGPRGGRGHKVIVSRRVEIAGEPIIPGYQPKKPEKKEILQLDQTRSIEK